MTSAPVSINPASFSSWPSLIIEPRIGTSRTIDQSYRGDRGITPTPKNHAVSQIDQRGCLDSKPQPPAFDLIQKRLLPVQRRMLVLTMPSEPRASIWPGRASLPLRSRASGQQRQPWVRRAQRSAEHHRGHALVRGKA